jgi:hypothetical protein
VKRGPATLLRQQRRTSAPVTSGSRLSSSPLDQAINGRRTPPASPPTRLPPSAKPTRPPRCARVTARPRYLPTGLTNLLVRKSAADAPRKLCLSLNVSSWPKAPFLPFCAWLLLVEADTAQISRSPSALRKRLHDFPFEAAANPFEQFPIMKPEHGLARFCIHGHPATLCARVLRYFNLPHLIPPSLTNRKSSGTSSNDFRITASSNSPSSGLPCRENATAPALVSFPASASA